MVAKCNAGFGESSTDAVMAKTPCVENQPRSAARKNVDQSQRGALRIFLLAAVLSAALLPDPLWGLLNRSCQLHLVGRKADGRPSPIARVSSASCLSFAA